MGRHTNEAEHDANFVPDGGGRDVRFGRLVGHFGRLVWLAFVRVRLPLL